MKLLVSILILFAVIAGVCALTGVRSYTSSSVTGVQLTYYSAVGRVSVAVLAVLCSFAAYGCAKRRAFGWWLVAAMLASAMLLTLAWAVWGAIVLDLPLAGKILGAMGEVIKIIFWGALLWTWMRKRESLGFLRSNTAPSH